MKLLTQADDFGFTKGCTAGIIDAIENGMLRNTGMFMNMPTTPAAAALVKDYPHVCFGIDFNLVSGPCVSDPKLIPNLVDENGEYIRSSVRIKDPRWHTPEGRLEMYPKEEVKREMQAHLDRYIELVGKKPGYLHTHSMRPESYLESISELAAENDIPFSWEMWAKHSITRPIFGLGNNDAANKKVFNPIAQLEKDPEGDFWSLRDEMLKMDIVCIGGHTGFVDAELFRLTSMSIERVKDHQLMTSPRVLEWIKENDVQLVTYQDIYQDRV